MANKEAERKSFLLYYSYFEAFSPLTDEQLGKLLRGVYTYEMEGRKPEFDDRAVAQTFVFVKIQLDIDREKYLATCAKNSANGKLGGRPKKAVGFLGFSEKPKEADEDKDEKEKEDDDDGEDNHAPTQQDFESACRKYSRSQVELYLQKVEAHQKQKGKVYPDKLAMACKWIQEDIDKGQIKLESEKSYDIDEFVDYMENEYIPPYLQPKGGDVANAERTTAWS